MTTQTATVGLLSEKGGSRLFEATATDATFTELTSKTGTLSAYDVVKGKTFTHAMGEFAAGLGLARVRNTITNKVKGYIILDVIGEGIYRKLKRPITIGDNDIVEAYVDVA